MPVSKNAERPYPASWKHGPGGGYFAYISDTDTPTTRDRD